jgi:hypothetical protein
MNMLSGMTRTRTYEALSRGLIRGKKLGGRTLVNVTSGLAYIEAPPDYPLYENLHRPFAPIARPPGRMRRADEISSS